MALTPQLLPSGYLRTSGSQIVDSNGNPVRISSVGLDSGWGLWAAPYTTILDNVKATGFNCIRIPWVNAQFRYGWAPSPGEVNGTLNPSLVGLNHTQIKQAMVTYCGQIGLKVIFDNHANSSWTPQQQNGLWYDLGGVSNNTDGEGNAGTTTDAQFLQDWSDFAALWQGNTTVIGFDLRNEPLGYYWDNMCSWEAGSTNPNQNIRWMYERVGNAIHQRVGNGPLIICEGPQRWDGSYANVGKAPWGDLSLVGSLPVVLANANKVVYSIHDYPWSICGSGGCTGIPIGGQERADLMTSTWGYIVKNNQAPVWIGECGGFMSYTDATVTQRDQQWATNLVNYCNGLASGGPTFTGSQQGIGVTWWSAGVASDGGVSGDTSSVVPNFGIWRDWNTGVPRTPQYEVYSKFFFFGTGGGGTGGSGGGGTTITPSPNGTVITTVGPAITDAAGNQWSLTGSAQVAVNGSPDPTTANVIQLAYVSGKVWQQNAALLWWSKTTPTDAWTPTDGTATSPLEGGAPVQSPDGTVVTTVGPAITDANGNSWTIANTGGTGGTGNFRVLNKKIYDPNGNEFIARGINADPVNQGVSFSTIQNLFPGINIIRWAIGSQPSPSYFEPFVAAATAAKCVVILYYHPWPLRNAHQGSELTALAAWMASLASYPAFKNNPYVWFSSPNEPQWGDGLPLTDITAEHVAVYNAIRSTATANNFILLSAGGGGGDPGGVGLGALSPTSAYATMTGVAFDCHFYGWMTNYSTNQNEVNAKLLGSASTATGILACNAISSADGSMPVITGEFGVSTTASQFDPNQVQDVEAVTNWAVIQNRYSSGFIAWQWIGDSYNALQNNGVLTAWGTNLRNRIQAAAQFASTLGSVGGSTGSGVGNRVVAPLAGTVTTGTYTRGTVAGQDYSILLPAQYDSSKVYPLLFFLHWNGLAWEWYNTGVDAVVRDEGGYWNNVNFRRNYPCFVAMPYCDQSNDNAGGAQINWGGYTKADQFSEGANIALIQYLLQTYPIDRTRIYVTGTSLGGHGSWGHMIKFGVRAGQKSLQRYFVAGMPCDGWSIEYFPSDTNLLNQLRNDPIWVYSANQDGSSVDFSRQWWNAYGGGTADGRKAPNGQMRYTEVSGGHGAGWSQAYSFGSTGNSNFDWLFSQEYGVTSGVQTRRVAVNGVPDTTTQNVQQIAYVGGKIWYQDQALLWRSKTLPTDAWAPTAGTSTSPIGGGGNPTPGPTTLVWNIHNGIQAWSGGSSVTRNVRRSNNGVAYACNRDGVTATSGGPTGTGIDIVDNTTRWRYISNVEFVDRSGAVSQLPATFTASLTWQFWNNASQSTTGGVPFINLTGHSMGSYSLTMRAGPGDGIRDALAAQTLPLAFNSTRGAAFIQPLATAAAINYVDINDARVIIDGLQWRDPDGSSGSTILKASSGCNSLVVRNCIFDGFAQAGSAHILDLQATGSLLFTNCLIIDRQPAASSEDCVLVSSPVTSARFVNCTFIRLTPGGGRAVVATGVTGVVLKNCAIFGYSAPTSSGVTIDHSVTSAANWGSGSDAGGNIFNQSASAQFVDQFTDWRLLPGSACVDAGEVALSDIPDGDDISKTIRKQGPSWDAGCWEREAFSMRLVHPPPIRIW